MILALALPLNLLAQTAPYSISPKWVFGNKAMFDFTGGGAPTQPVRTDNIIANEGGSTLCSRDKNVMVYDNNVRVAGNNHTPLGTVMTASSSSTQGGVIIPHPNNPATQFFIITANAEATYTAQEPNDQSLQGIKVYSSSQSGASITNPVLVTSLTSTGGGSAEQLVAGVDDNYGYWIIYEIGTIYNNGNPNFNSVRVTTAGVSGSTVASSYNTNGNWNFQAQGTIKLNRCQNKIAIVQSSKIAVFEWDRASGQIGSVIKYITGVNVGGGSKLYGCEFSANGRYLYASTLGGSDLIVVDTEAAGGTSTGLSYKNGQTASGSLQIGPNDVIYVANGLDGATNTAIGTITNANTGGTYTPNGITLINSSSVRLGINNLPWLNPQRPTITPVNNSCGKYTFTTEFLTHFNDDIGVSKAVWDFGDGSATVTNTGANAMDPVTHDYSSLGTKNVTVTLTDATCGYTWDRTISQNVDCILPVDLLKFEATRLKSTSTQLFWITSQEVNNSHFEIQHSVDGIHYTTVGSVRGNGNTSLTKNYSFIHENPSIGNNYYRLIQYDYDGRTEISDVRVIAFEGIDVEVSPNPSGNSFNVSIEGANSALMVVKDLTGREVYRTELTENMVDAVSFGELLLPATYILQIITLNETKTIKIVKNN